MNIRNTVNKYNKDIFIRTKTMMTKDHIDKIGNQLEALSNNAIDVTNKLKNTPEPEIISQCISKVNSMESILDRLSKTVNVLEKRLTALEAGDNSYIKVTSVSLNPTVKEMRVNDTFNLTATVLPANAHNKNIIWVSSDASKASVVNGLVTAKEAGTCKITCDTEDGNKTASCTLTIKPLIVPVTSVRLNESTATINETQTVNLVATVAPENATNKNVIWESSNTAIATVNNGLVTALKAGSCNITCRTQDENKSATCAVTVNKMVIPVQSISLNSSSKDLVEETTFKLVASVTPENATDKSLVWSSSNTQIATVDQQGTITSVKPGTCTISCKTTDGRVVSNCTLRVSSKIIPVASVNITQQTANVSVGSKIDLTATVLPTNASNNAKTWASSAKDVATVDAAGRVTGVKEGKTTITVTTTDGNKTDTCEVTVKAPIINVASMTLDTTEKIMNKNDKLQLTATVLPANATDKSVTWTSSNSATASVDRNGLVTAKTTGQATITCTTTDGNKTATCGVTVKEIPATVSSTDGVHSL